MTVTLPLVSFVTHTPVLCGLKLEVLPKATLTVKEGPAAAVDLQYKDEVAKALAKRPARKD